MNYNLFTLGELVTIKYGKNQKKVQSKDGTVPIYGTGGLMGYATDAIYDKPSVLIGRKGTINKVRYVYHPFWTVDTLFYTEVNEALVFPKYLYYLMSLLDLNSYNEGTTIPSLRTETLNRLEFDIPDLNYQEKVLAMLEPIDKKIKLDEEVNENLAKQIEALLLAFLESDGALSVKLGDYLYIKGRIGWKGLKKSEYLSQSEYRIINGETLTQSGIDWNKAGYISEERYDESPEIMLKVGDILLSKDGTIGKIGYVDSLELPTSVASGIFVIRNTKPDIISTTFIYYLLKSRIFTSFIAARTEGSVIPHLYQKDFMEFEFPLPTPEKMAEFEEITEPMFSQIINNLNENKRLVLLRDGLLPKLMSGELDVSALYL